MFALNRGPPAGLSQEGVPVPRERGEDDVHVALAVVEVECDPETAVALGGDDPLGGQRLDERSGIGGADADERAPARPGAGGVTPPPPASPSPSSSRVASAPTCASIVGGPTSSISDMPATPP